MKKVIVFLVSIIVIFSMISLTISCKKEQVAETTAAETTAAETTAAMEEEIIIGMSNVSGLAFHVDLGASARKVVTEAGGEFIELNCDFDSVKQLNQTEDLIASNINSLMTIPLDPQGLQSVIQEAKDLGIGIVCNEIPLPDLQDAYVVSDNIEIGKIGARKIAEILEEKYGKPEGKVILVGNEVYKTMLDRNIGFIEAIENEYPDIEIIDKREELELSIPAALDLGSDLLELYPVGGIDMFFTTNSSISLGILAAIESANRTEIKIMAVDEDPGILENLKKEDGLIVGTIVQDPILLGKLGAEAAIKLAMGGEIENENIIAEVELITRENLNQYLEKRGQLDAEIAPYRI